MGFRPNAYAKVWSTEDKGNYSVGNVSISRKNKDTNQYDTEFQDGFVRFVGNAHDTIKNLTIPDNGLSIQITSCDVTNKYDAEKKKSYTNFVIFGFNSANSKNDSYSGAGSNKTNQKPSKGAKNSKSNIIPDIEPNDDDDLPF